jgi:hypothetical protein
MTKTTTAERMIDRLASPNNSFAELLALEESRWIRDWLLAILRFAVTREQCDRAAVMGLAAEMDRLGSGRSPSSFGFFTRTSANFCDCVVAKGFDKAAELCLHINRISADRLRRAFAAVLLDKSIEPGTSKKLDRERLWKGLAAR